MPPMGEEGATLESVKDYYGKVSGMGTTYVGWAGAAAPAPPGGARVRLPLSTSNSPRARPRSARARTGQVLATSKDLKTSACTAAGRPHAKLLEIFKKIPTEVMEKFYGCGGPLPLGIDGGVYQGEPRTDDALIPCTRATCPDGCR